MSLMTLEELGLKYMFLDVDSIERDLLDKGAEKNTIKIVCGKPNPSKFSITTPITAIYKTTEGREHHVYRLKQRGATPDKERIETDNIFGYPWVMHQLCTRKINGHIIFPQTVRAISFGSHYILMDEAPGETMSHQLANKHIPKVQYQTIYESAIETLAGFSNAITEHQKLLGIEFHGIAKGTSVYNVFTDEQYASAWVRLKLNKYLEHIITDLTHQGYGSTNKENTKAQKNEILEERLGLANDIHLAIKPIYMNGKGTVDHGDGRTNNLIVNNSPNEKDRIKLIDLDSVRCINPYWGMACLFNDHALRDKVDHEYGRAYWINLLNESTPGISEKLLDNGGDVRYKTNIFFSALRYLAYATEKQERALQVANLRKTVDYLRHPELRNKMFRMIINPAEIAYKLAA